jgi:hypothetical protein
MFGQMRALRTSMKDECGLSTDIPAPDPIRLAVRAELRVHAAVMFASGMGGVLAANAVMWCLRAWGVV